MVRLVRAIQAIDAILSDQAHSEILQTGDPLVDKWERDLEQGREPDLTEGLDKLPARVRRRLGLEEA